MVGARTRCRFPRRSTAKYRIQENVQPQPAYAHAKLSVYVLGILNHAMGEHRPKRGLTTPNSILRSIKLWHILPALLNSLHGRLKRRQRFSLVESSDVILFLSWLMTYIRRGNTRPSNCAHETSEAISMARVTSVSLRGRV